MSYSSRIYRQRNVNQDGKKKNTIFPRKDQEKANAASRERQASQHAADSFEQEADSVANAVVSNDMTGRVIHSVGGGVQRLATSKEDEKASTNDERMKQDKDVQEKLVQRMDDKKREEPVQKKDEEKKDEAVQKKDEERKDDGVQKKDEERKDEAVQKKEEERKDEGVQKKDDEKKEEKIQASDEKDKDKVQKKDEPKEDEKDPAIQKKENRDVDMSAEARIKYLRESKGKGRPLPPDTLREMNSKFGYNFGAVRIHDDAAANRVSQAFNAQAFTHGNDVYFNEGKFNPATTDGKLLLAHELTHVVQQNGRD